MAYDFEYPYTDSQKFNDDWLLTQVMNALKEISNFVNLNTIKYADPILWNIESSYEANTVVIDGQSGNAYISVKPVPSGVHLSRTEYWTQIYNYADTVDTLRSQIASNEKESTTATKPYNVNDLVFVNGDLYRVIANMIAGDSFVENSNVVKTTIDAELKRITAFIGDLSDLDTEDKSSLVAAVNEVFASYSSIVSSLGDLSNLNTTDKSSLVNAINEVLSTLNTTLNITIGDLTSLDTTDKSSIVNAINEVLSTLNTTAGDLNDLDTTDKSSLVAAINEVLSSAEKNMMVNVKDFGAVGDGVTNDYNAINNAILHALNEGLSIIYFPNGDYYCGAGTFDIDSSKITFMGAENTKLISSGLTGDDAFITITSPLSLGQYSFARVPLMNICIHGDYFTDTSSTGVIGVKMGTDTTLIAPHIALYNVVIEYFAIGLELSSAYKSSYYNLSVIACNRGVNVPSAGVQQAVPCNFYGCYFECCNYALFGGAGGYNNISFFGGAFEYNRSVFTTVTKLVFVGVRFEYDCKASCDSALNVRAVFNGAASAASSTVVKFISCFFLGLNNFAENVQYWISNPYKATAYNISPIYVVGGSRVSLEMFACEVEDVNMPTGVYYISTDKFYGAGNYKGGSITDIVDPNYVVTQTNGFI